MRKIGLLSFILIVLSLPGYAQHYLGVAQSNWSGLLGVEQNPANVVDNRLKFDLELMGLNFGLDNNLAGVNLNKAFTVLNGTGKVKDLFNFSDNKQINLLLPYAEIKLLNVMANINHKNSIAFSFKLRGMNQISNFDGSLFRTIMDSTFSPANNYNVTSQNFNWTANTWSEFNLTYGRVLYERNEHMLKAGLTLKYLGGIKYVSMKGKNMNISFSGAKDSLHVSNTDMQVSSNSFDSTMNLGSNFSDVLNNISGQNGGNGIGADLGLVYEYRPDIDEYTDPKTKALDPGRNKYKFKISLSIKDLGAINYKNSYTVNISGNGIITADDVLKNFLNYGSVKRYTESRGFFVDTFAGTTKVYLPSMFIGSIDYKIWKPFYINLTYLANLANRNNFGNSFYNQICINPRIDTKIFSFSVPVSYSSLTGGTKIGMGLRMGGFYIGMDDMLLLFSNNQYGMNFYTGLFVPINKKKAPRGESENDVKESSNDKVIK
jgi:hypothetical protein